MAQCEECREWHHDDYDLDPNGYCTEHSSLLRCQECEEWFDHSNMFDEKKCNGCLEKNDTPLLRDRGAWSSPLAS